MSGRTYISQLKRQLDDEREARQKLEGELEDLKKISSEITSHLSLIQKQQEEGAAEEKQWTMQRAERELQTRCKLFSNSNSLN